jgi:hypothetical protein
MSRTRAIRFALPAGVLIAVLSFAGVPAVDAQTTAPADQTPAAVQPDATSQEASPAAVQPDATSQEASPAAVQSDATPKEASTQEVVVQKVAETIGSIKFSYAFQLYMQSRDTGSGPNGTDTTTDIYFKRNRLMLGGQMNDVYGFYAAFQFQGDERIYPLTVESTPQSNFDVIDTYFVADWSDEVRLRAGLTKDPMIREDNESCFEPLSLDRSYFVYTDLPRLNRDFGVVLWGNLMDALFQYRLAAMQGNDSSTDPKSTLRYTARAHVSLLDPEYSLSYKGTYLGKKKVLTLGAGYQFESDAVYGNVAGMSDAKDYKAYTYDVFFEYPTKAGTFTASGAYLKEDFDGAYKGSDPDPRSIGLYGEKNGWYSKAGYLLPGKIIGGQFQVFGRYEKWKFAQLQGIYDQEIKWTALGANYFIYGEDLRLTLEYSKNDYAQETATVQDFNTWTLMLQVRI